MTIGEGRRALLWAAVADLDLQTYKATVYKLRWDSPGVGLDMALPALEDARLTLQEVPEWPEALSGEVAYFRSALSKYTHSLEIRDHTTASGQQTDLLLALARLRAALRAV